jgi:hypothetical protein
VSTGGFFFRLIQTLIPITTMVKPMIAGFLTSYPVNWWLIRKGISETM